MSARAFLAGNCLKHCETVALRFIQFRRKNSPHARLGIVSDDGSRFSDLNIKSVFPRSMTEFLRNDFNANELKIVQDIAHVNIEELPDDLELLSAAISSLKLLSLDYAPNSSHVGKGPKIIIRNKLPTSLTGPTSPIVLPQNVKGIKVRPELAVVIGRDARNVSAASAMDHVFGYSIALNTDTSPCERTQDKFLAASQPILNRSCDAFCPIGPSIVHKSLVPDPYALKAVCKVNETVVCSDITNGFLHPIENIVEFLSKFVTLRCGDVVLLGPPNYRNDMERQASECARAGDVIRTEIEHIGALRNCVVDIDMKADVTK